MYVGQFFNESYSLGLRFVHHFVRVSTVDIENSILEAEVNVAIKAYERRCCDYNFAAYVVMIGICSLMKKIAFKTDFAYCTSDADKGKQIDWLIPTWNHLPVLPLPIRLFLSLFCLLMMWLL